MGRKVPVKGRSKPPNHITPGTEGELPIYALRQNKTTFDYFWELWLILEGKDQRHCLGRGSWAKLTASQLGQQLHQHPQGSQPPRRNLVLNRMPCGRGGGKWKSPSRDERIQREAKTTHKRRILQTKMLKHLKTTNGKKRHVNQMQEVSPFTKGVKGHVWSSQGNMNAGWILDDMTGCSYVSGGVYGYC